MIAPHNKRLRQPITTPSAMIAQTVLNISKETFPSHEYSKNTKGQIAA